MDYLVGWIYGVLEHHPLAAPVVFIFAHTVLAVCVLPCSPMTMLAGALWGGVEGVVVSGAAALVSSATTFSLSRTFLRDRIERFILRRYPKVAKPLQQIASHDWRIIAVLWLSPLIPASTAGYVFGLSSVTLPRYLGFSVVFMLPLQVLLVMTGHSAATLFSSEGQWGMTVVLIMLVIGVSFLSKRISAILARPIGGMNEP